MRFTFRLYSIALDAVRLVGPAATAIARHDADLARQLRRALQSLCLNISEGMDAHGRNRHALFRIALGSTNECIGALDVADALGYFTADAATHDKLQHVRATLLRLVVPRR